MEGPDFTLTQPDLGEHACQKLVRVIIAGWSADSWTIDYGPWTMFNLGHQMDI